MQNTLKNLAKAFIGESQARNRYTMYAKIAKKEGYEQISTNFLETAEQEAEHAKWLMKMMNDLKNRKEENIEEIVVSGDDVPTVMGTTEENLKAAINGENHEQTNMYPEFAEMADKEDLREIAVRLRSIAKAEKHHEERYRKLFVELEAGTLYQKQQEREWICRKCGYQHSGETPPEKCPSCDHPKNYFQIKCEEY